MKAVCNICGKPMPEGEEMFKFHGYSGPCPKEPFEVRSLMETFEQPKITGYRQLNEAEAELMNEVKELGKTIDGHVEMIRSYLRTQFEEANSDERARIGLAEPSRWAAVARTDFQTALMALVRAVAQPTSF